MNLKILFYILNPVLHRWIDNYQGIYSVNIQGKIFSHKKGKVKEISQSRLGKKYLKVSLYKDGSLFQESVHRIVVSAFLGLEKNYYVDHIDHDGHNNNLSNLRVCTPSQSSHYRIEVNSNSNGVRGVHRSGNKFYAMISVENCPIYLGMYDTIEMASNAYKKASKKYYNEFSIA